MENNNIEDSIYERILTNKIIIRDFYRKLIKNNYDEKSLKIVDIIFSYMLYIDEELTTNEKETILNNYNYNKNSLKEYFSSFVGDYLMDLCKGIVSWDNRTKYSYKEIIKKLQQQQKEQQIQQLEEDTIIEELNILKENLNKTQVENIKLKTQNEILTIQLQKYIQQIKQNTERLQNLEIQMEILCKDNQKQNEQHKNDKRQTESTKENLNFQEQIYNITEQIKQVQLQQQTNHQQNQIQQDQSEYDQLQWSESSQTQVKSKVLNKTKNKKQQKVKQSEEYVEKKDFEELLKKVNDLQMQSSKLHEENIRLQTQNTELKEQITKSDQQKDKIKQELQNIVEKNEQNSEKFNDAITMMEIMGHNYRKFSREIILTKNKTDLLFEQLGLNN